jgi:hypothetical protein
MSDKCVSISCVTVVANRVKPDIDVDIGHALLMADGD